ncbi:MAG: MSHA biogenesis protein MshK [Gammaproteobacteria bacterium]|nr:MSHA biogenesis protein MshK [Gammaproteobacteria bacterium]MBU3988985.1 MSHA biogenesis protein MshK [Gammaproteobacteria bacterium]MBU4003897.1 MSHA biogenesis protein MshK [Gammaproteobacteria bacterium]MBU4022532.1 MSHA biogenesis protein MshK [Gammaproteobacteria bacterium]MBU4097032.1 MSHA biogenesis protein MshK [Gammaproteobacteria bacterium]
MATLFLALAGVAHAQLTDPTRPPTAISAADPAAAAVFEASGLQSVILRKHGKPAALINGEVVELGGKVGEAKLIRISEDSIVLRGPQGDETLRLIPAAEKKVGAGGTAQKPAQKAAQNRKTDK